MASYFLDVADSVLFLFFYLFCTYICINLRKAFFVLLSVLFLIIAMVTDSFSVSFHSQRRTLSRGRPSRECHVMTTASGSGSSRTPSCLSRRVSEKGWWGRGGFDGVGGVSI